MTTVNDIAKNLVMHSGGIYTEELLDTIPENLRGNDVNRETLHAIIAIREQKKLEFAKILNLEPDSESVYGALDFEIAKRIGCLAEAIRTKFFFNLAACISVELSNERQMKKAPADPGKTLN